MAGQCLNNDDSYNKEIQRLQRCAKEGLGIQFSSRFLPFITRFRDDLYVNKKGSCLYLPFKVGEIDFKITK